MTKEFTGEFNTNRYQSLIGRLRCTVRRERNEARCYLKQRETIQDPRENEHFFYRNFFLVRRIVMRRCAARSFCTFLFVSSTLPFPRFKSNQFVSVDSPVFVSRTVTRATSGECKRYPCVSIARNKRGGGTAISTTRRHAANSLNSKAAPSRRDLILFSSERKRKKYCLAFRSLHRFNLCSNYLFFEIYILPKKKKMSKSSRRFAQINDTARFEL